MRQVLLLPLGILFLRCVVTENNSAPCPGLPTTEGMVVTCMDPKNNSTVDCSSSSAVPRGTVAEYRCEKKTDQRAQENNKLVCACKGKWKGIPKFNEVAGGCGATKLSLKLGNSVTATLEAKTIEGNGDTGLSGESDLDGSGSVDVSVNEGGETKSGSSGSLVVGKNENGTLSASALVMPSLSAKENESSTETALVSTSESNENNTSTPLHDEGTTTPASESGSSSSSSTPEGGSSTPASSDGMSSSGQTSEPSPSLGGMSSSTDASTSSASSNASSDSANSTSEAPTSTSEGMSSSSDSNTTPASTSSSAENRNISGSTEEVPKVATEGPGQVPEKLTTLVQVPEKPTTLAPEEENTIRHSKNLALDNGNVNQTISSEAPSEGPENALKIVPPSAGENATAVGLTSDSSMSSMGGSSTPSMETSSVSSGASDGTMETSSESSASSSAAPEGSTSTTPASGSDSAGKSDDFHMKALELHNTLREEHQSQPLKLNATLSKIAQDWADQEVTKSSIRVSPGKRKYAENMYRVRGGAPLTPTEAVELAFKSWSSSSKYFNFDRPKPTAFSQIVWNKTTDMGIGVAQHGSQSVVVATYYPRGNVVVVDSKTDPGYFFKRNVFPCKDNKTEGASSTTPSTMPGGVTEESSTTSSVSVSISSEASIGTTLASGQSSASSEESSGSSVGTSSSENLTSSSSTTESGMSEGSSATATTSMISSEASSSATSEAGASAVTSSSSTTESGMSEGSSAAASMMSSEISSSAASESDTSSAVPSSSTVSSGSSSTAEGMTNEPSMSSSISASVSPEGSTSTGSSTEPAPTTIA